MSLATAYPWQDYSFLYSNTQQFSIVTVTIITTIITIMPSSNYYSHGIIFNNCCNQYVIAVVINVPLLIDDM